MKPDVYAKVALALAAVSIVGTVVTTLYTLWRWKQEASHSYIGLPFGG